MQQKILALVLLCGLFFSACTPSEATSTVDPNAIGTAIVSTTIAQLAGQYTQTALAMPSTDVSTTIADISTLTPLSTELPPTLEGITTPLAVFTQLPAFPSPVPTSSLGDACNNSAFEGDITIPDGTILKPGEDFQKIWKIRNTGSCTWDDGFTFVYIGGSTPDLDPYNFGFKKSSDFVPSGSAANIGLNLTAPLNPGLYEGHWRMRNDQGYYFGTILSVYIEVKGTAPSYP